jgi:hypothetical protein
MESRNIFLAICLMPILLIYSVIEIRRGWKILKQGEPSLNLALQARVWLLGLIRGSKAADEYRSSLLMDKNAMQVRGVYSLIGGGVSLIGSAILILSWLL